MANPQVSKDFLLGYVQRNIWCTPEQDRQANLQLPRVTPEGGAWITFSYQWRNYQLPLTENLERFHIYQIGQTFPELLGLLPSTRSKWISAEEAMEANNLILDVYNGKGVMIPRQLCWYMLSGDKNILLAVMKPEEFRGKLIDVDLEHEPVYMRVYNNAYFKRPDTQLPDLGIQLVSGKPKTVAEFNEFQSKVLALPSYGIIYQYVNGRRVDQIDLINTKVGDYVEAVFDASVKREVFFPVKDLQEFESTLDGIHKFLLHYNGTSDIIDYHDDIDIYIGHRYGNDKWEGVYLHRNDSRTARMVTHRDYSVPVIRVNGAKAANAFLADKAVEVRLTIRNSGWVRPLVFEDNRIKELYKLPQDKIIKAMVGLDATVPVWNATNLENSAYTAVMRQKQGAITRPMAQAALGYNAVSKLLGDTPDRVKLISGQKLVVIPPGLVGCCTVYEYSADGLLLYYTANIVDNTYTCQAPGAAFVELIYGIGGTKLDCVDNVPAGVLTDVYNYRFYTKELATSQWVDRSGSNYYLVNGDNYTWVPGTYQSTRLLSNYRHLAYTFNMAPLNGAFEFYIAAEIGGVYKRLDIPLGELDIFFNGYSLLEGLDYIVKDSRVVIITKKYFDANKTQQEITVRYTGFCNPDMTRTPPPDSGYVFHGVLSANNKYNIRDDKVLRIVADGKVRLREDIKFAEDGITAMFGNVPNGAPYGIRDIVVPMNNYLVGGVTKEDKTYELRAKSMVIDEQISDYMTILLPQDKPTTPNIIPQRYTLYSPFISRIMADLLSGALQDDKFFQQFNDTWLDQRLDAYKYLLDFDLSAKNSPLDIRYLVVHAHPYPNYVTVNPYQMRVIQRAAALFTRNVEINATVSVQ